MRLPLLVASALVLGGIVASCGDDRDSAPIGPSREEQALWQLVNRARADPAAEAHRLLTSGDDDVEAALDAFGVDRARIRADFDAYDPQPPLAWDMRLADAARRHALDLVATRSQSHRGSDGSLPGARVADAGATAGYVVENITSAARSPFHAHASLLVDWGGEPPTGVQGWPSPGHRMAVLAPQRGGRRVTAIGMAWVEMPAAGNDPFGPFVLVQELADIGGTFVVGTVWRDADGDGVHGPGEGVGGVSVSVGTDGPAVETWSEGTYQVPVDAMSGTVTVRAVDGAVVEGNVVEASVVLMGVNALVDLRLPPR